MHKHIGINEGHNSDGLEYGACITWTIYARYIYLMPIRMYTSYSIPEVYPRIYALYPSQSLRYTVLQYTLSYNLYFFSGSKIFWTEKRNKIELYTLTTISYWRRI